MSSSAYGPVLPQLRWQYTSSLHAGLSDSRNWVIQTQSDTSIRKTNTYLPYKSEQSYDHRSSKSQRHHPKRRSEQDLSRYVPKYRYHLLKRQANQPLKDRSEKVSRSSHNLFDQSNLIEIRIA